MGLIPGVIWSEPEFQGGLTGACGPNALAMLESWADQKYKSTLEVYNSMVKSGLCDKNGVTNMADIITQTSNDKFTIGKWVSGDWQSFFNSHVPSRPVLYLTANGQALRDSITGKGEDATNLKGHFLLVVGRHQGGRDSVFNLDLPHGWYCVDGDNWAGRQDPPASHRVVFYTDDILAASQPIAAIAIYPRVQMQQPTKVPMGWTDNDKVLTAPNGKVATLGFRWWILTHDWDPANVPLGNAYSLDQVEIARQVGSGTRQDFALGSLGWTTKTDVYVIAIGPEMQIFASKVGDLMKQATDLQGQLKAKQDEVDGLTKQLADAKAKPQLDTSKIQSVIDLVKQAEAALEVTLTSK